MNVTLHGWQALWRELGAAQADSALFARVIAAWSEPQRHYHTLMHLRECLAQLESAQALLQRPAQARLALWFHDAVYDPTRSDNEERSADWARTAVAAAGLPTGIGERVHAMVMATRHDGIATDTDTRLLVDSDLATLAAPPRRYEEYAQQIRREYQHVPEAEFRQRRKRILQGFLQRPAIFASAHFRAALEQPARENIAAEIARL
ncbi:N-methyl-D-aspartate receptor NMDAR2C subunit [Caenimonas terrae]|uniref:N-methyl-D-aspartate receptor NMDAR2C subunit n=1 Tax=Caenimonas terrae TaxID=696074 RepID=A0ABW0NIE2_9BURK